MATRGNPDVNQATAWLVGQLPIAPEKSPALARLKSGGRPAKISDLPAQPPPKVTTRGPITEPTKTVRIRIRRTADSAGYTITVPAAPSRAALAWLREHKLAELERITRNVQAHNARLDASLAHFARPVPKGVTRALSEFIKSNPPAPPLRPRRR